MKKAYISKTFHGSSMAIIAKANEIIAEYQADDLKLTLRQLYYQFVARDLIRNKMSEYKRLGNIINDARLAGLIDWYAIEDRTRSLRGNNHWNNPGEIVEEAARSFRLDHWRGQKYHVEVWIEKEALSGVIAGICQELDVDYFACKGYVSQSEMWGAARRLRSWSYDDREAVIIHLGDHDPSGIDMTRDIADRQELFLSGEGITAQIHRIALNMDQVEEYEPPPNPAKITDSRCEGYIKRFGRESWELDALEPRVLRELIRDKVLQFRDDDQYQKVLQQEQEYKTILARVEKNWRTL